MWGSTEQQLPLPEAVAGAMRIGDLIYSRYRFFACGFAVLAIVALWLFLEKTPYGAIIKAGAHDSEMVRALGINLGRLRAAVFALGVALAALAGVVMAPIWGIRPQVGVDAVVPAFTVIVLGGVGSLWGAVVAGLMVGMVVGLSGAFASEWSMLSMYLLFIAVVRSGRGASSAARACSMFEPPTLGPGWRWSPAPAAHGRRRGALAAQGCRGAGRHPQRAAAAAGGRWGAARWRWPATSAAPTTCSAHGHIADQLGRWRCWSTMPAC